MPFVNWSDAIKPLDKGKFSLLPFLQALRDSGYHGPVVLRTFGITRDPGHLECSILEYEPYLGQLHLLVGWRVPGARLGAG